MPDTTVITVADGNWNYLANLVIAARVAASQPPLPEMTARTIIYTADKDNAARLFRISDPLSGGEGEPLLAEESWTDEGVSGDHKSLRVWYLKGTIGDKLEVAMSN